mgnify:CR=1 FL=1
MADTSAEVIIKAEHHNSKEDLDEGREILEEGVDHFIFEAPVCSFEGVGRFVLGLCHEIEIIEPEGLKTFLQERVKKFL